MSTSQVEQMKKIVNELDRCGDVLKHVRTYHKVKSSIILNTFEMSRLGSGVGNGVLNLFLILSAYRPVT